MGFSGGTLEPSRWMYLSFMSLGSFCGLAQFLIFHLTFYRYTDMHADYSGQGFDQLLDVINKIKHNPDDRRIILSAWNPSDLKLMALPPCHIFAQVCSYIWVYLGITISFSRSPFMKFCQQKNFCSFTQQMGNYRVKCISDLRTWAWGCHLILHLMLS